ncbi:thioredoxin domain-containing protein [Fodinicurvata halophila]|uniref:hypothetical protein n=1 Tax=Fodinicurvata halophila TaxID=1419723 RepID=UPI00362847FF
MPAFDPLAEAEGVAVEWKPFLLMPLLVEQGLENGPFLPFPNKLAYMWRISSAALLNTAFRIGGRRSTRLTRS